MADFFDSVGPEIDPQWAAGGFTGGNPPPYLSTPGIRVGEPAPGSTTGGPPAPEASSSAPQAGQWSANNQGFLDWATKTFGADRNSFVKIPPGQLPAILQRYTAETGNQAKFIGGPSGDQVDFGQGVRDALTSSGQIWRDESKDYGTPGGGGPGTGGGGGGGGGPTPWGGGSAPPGGGGGGGSNVTLPTAPAARDLTAPDPFTYQPSNLGQFQSPSQVPQMAQLGYNPMQAPQSMQAQQLPTQFANLGSGGGPVSPDGGWRATPEQAGQVGGKSPSMGYGGGPAADVTGMMTTYQQPGVSTWNSATGGNLGGASSSGGVLQAGGGGQQPMPSGGPPQAGALERLQYNQIATPGAYQAEKYQGLNAADLNSGPAADAYKWRFDQGQKATENALAHSGSLRTGNALTALADYGQGAASQEYAAADARARATNAINNQSSLGAYQTNAQTGLAYNQANQQGQMAATQGNISNQQNAINANNATNLAYGGQNFNQAFATNQANNAGQFQATQANNQNALAQQGQQFGQGLAGYQANQAAQNQMYQQALGAYGMNAQTGLAYGSQNQNNQLANYQAQVNAALGQGNLNLGFQNSAQNYALGQGGLNLQQQGLGLQQQNQQWGQGLDIYDRNYRANVTDPWMQQYQLASLGNPGAPNTQGNANAQSGLYTDQGNAQAAGTVGAANAYGQMASNLGNTAQSAAAYYAWLRNQPQATAGGGGGQLPGR